MRLLLLPLTLAVSLALVPTAANAQRVSLPDPRGDVVGETLTASDPGSQAGESDCDDYTSTPADATGVPNVDLTRLTVIHGRDALVVKVAFADLETGDVNLDVPMLTPDKDYTVEVDRWRKQVQVDWEPREQTMLDHAQAQAQAQGSCYFAFSPNIKECRGLHAHLAEAADEVTISIPRHCMKDPRWVRVAADTYGSGEDDHHGDFSLFYDHWAAAAADDARQPHYGPRVRTSVSHHHG